MVPLYDHHMFNVLLYFLCTYIQVYKFFLIFLFILTQMPKFLKYDIIKSTFTCNFCIKKIILNNFFFQNTLSIIAWTNQIFSSKIYPSKTWCWQKSFACLKLCSINSHYLKNNAHANLTYFDWTINYSITSDTIYCQRVKLNEMNRWKIYLKQTLLRNNKKIWIT